MSIQVAGKIYNLFDELVSEYLKELAIYNNDPKQYIKNSDFIFGGIVNPSSKEELKIIERRIADEIPAVRQLYKNNRIVELTTDIADLLPRHYKLNFKSSESHALVDKILFEFINSILCVVPFPDERKQKSILKEIIGKNISTIRNDFAIYEFKFPVHIIGLDTDVAFNKRAYLERSDKSLVDSDGMKKYLFSRTFEPNYDICIASKIKGSYKYSEERAVRASKAILNILTLLYGCHSGNSSWLSPIVRAESQRQHSFSYFHSARQGEPFEETSSYRFSYNHEIYKGFWDCLKRSFSTQENLYKLLFSIPDRIMSNDNFNKSVCSIVERSLKWFSDAVDEKDYEVKLVKLAIAVESLVNFKNDSQKDSLDSDRFKRMFVDRVCIINRSDTKSERKAIEIYNARSSVAHGSPLKKRLDFDVVQFVATTLLLAIQLFSNFKKNGLDEVGFNKELPQFIEDYPNLHL